MDEARKEPRPETADSLAPPAAESAAAARPDRREAHGLLLLAIVAATYLLVVGSHLSHAYIDLGDGNYLYTAGRMADGLRIYRDFLSPQPPMHLLTGSLLIRLGRLYDEPLMTVRVFSMALHVLTMVWVYLLGRRLTRSPLGGALAAAIYALLPLGFWWSLGYQSEPLEMFFLLGALWLFLELEPRRMIAAGALTAFAVLTNMTAAPYALGCLVYLAVRHPVRLLPAFAGPFAGVLAAAIGYYEITTGAYLENVILNQVGSYPTEGLLGYALSKIAVQGSKILSMEGGWIALGLLGLLLYNRRDRRPEREFLVWYALILLLSIVYVSKGGTVDYIFTIGEPMVALFAAYFLHDLLRREGAARLWLRPLWRDTSRAPQVAFFCLLAVVIGAKGFAFIAMTLDQQQFEQRLDDRDGVIGFERIAYFIERHSKPGDRILAHPFYAFATDRLLIEEYSELFLWYMKYINEMRAEEPGKGVEKVRTIAEALRERRLPVVIAATGAGWEPGRPLPRGPMILFSDEIRTAVDRYYKPLDAQGARYRTLNFEMAVFVPKTDAELAGIGSGQ